MRAARPGLPGVPLLPVLILVLLASTGLSSCSGGGPKPPPKPPLAGTVLEWNLSGFSQHRGAPAPGSAGTGRRPDAAAAGHVPAAGGHRPRRTLLESVRPAPRPPVRDAAR